MVAIFAVYGEEMEQSTKWYNCINKINIYRLDLCGCFATLPLRRDLLCTRPASSSILSWPAPSSSYTSGDDKQHLYKLCKNHDNSSIQNKKQPIITM